MELDLAGKATFVAGSSRGIGLAIARGFLTEGARVTITGRDPEALETARADLATLAGADRVLAIPVDMSDATALVTALDRAEATHGPLDAVVANVGSGSGLPGFALDRSEWERVLNQNLLGSTLLAGEVLKRLVARGAGSLTLIGSIAGLEAIGAPIPYAAAKAALTMAVKSYARQVGPQGVRVNAIAPGNVLFPGGSWEKKLVERGEFFDAYIHAEVPLQRFGRPEEIADMAVFLASSRASFITGAVMVVDGGQTRGTF